VTFLNTHRFVKKFESSFLLNGPGTVMGGADRQITVIAKRTGCFRYSVGACTAGAIYGMCGNTDTELVVSAGN